MSCLELRIVIGSVWQLPYNALAPYSDIMNVKFHFWNFFLRKRSSVVLRVSKLFLEYNTSFHQLHAASLYLEADSPSVRQWLLSIPKSKINFWLNRNPTLNAIPKTMNHLTPNFLKFILILPFRLRLHFLTGTTLKFSELISVLLKVATTNIRLIICYQSR